MNAQDTAEVVRAYHNAWTHKDYARARALLAGTLAVEVPVNDYPTAESFAAALESFGSMVSNAELLAAMSDGNEAMLLYDLQAGPVGRLRVAEHFTVEGGKITRIRQIHDTAAVRAAGLADVGELLRCRERTGIVTARPGEAPDAEATAYTQKLIIRVPRERVFGAIASLDGPRCWWTTILTGSAAPGGTLHFGFAGLDEQIAMRVDAVRPLSGVEWSCAAHSRDDEWTGSTVRFGLDE
jgi:ketosteroid isomerase-like protein